MTRTSARVLAVILLCSCGEAPPAGAPAPDVRGSRFVRPRPPEPEPPSADLATLGDPDRPAPEEMPAPAPAAAAPPPAAASTPSAPEGEAQHLTWDDLAGFEVAPYAAETKDAPKYPIPDKILALSGTKVAAEGFMAPLVYEAGGAKKFLLLKDPMACCFAVTPKINEWIEVTMEGGSVAEYVPHVLITVYGDLDVKEETRSGMAVGLYKMRATRAEFTDAK